MKKLKKVCNWLLVLFLAMTGYLLLAMWQDWPFGTAGICSYLAVVGVTLLLTTVVAIATIGEELKSKGWRGFAIGFCKRLAFFGITLAAAGLLKQSFEPGKIVLMTFGLTILNYYYRPQ